MCGIAGFVEYPIRSHQQHLMATARAMAASICHRGPDDFGEWADEEAGVAFGFRRLAILDLSPAGHQPMLSRDGRYVVAFNGEIYNFRDLRTRLRRLGHGFTGASDTEVLLAGFVEWGVRRTIDRCHGMFAMAVWDRTSRELYLVRDRLGKKPLYYGFVRGALLFGSELKALRAHSRFQGKVDRLALQEFFRHGWIPAPASIFEDIRKLPPGTIVQISAGKTPRPPDRYWSFDAVADQGTAHPFAGTVDDALDELEKLLADAVAKRMVADVPLGAFLSGGTDSSLVVALMQAQSRDPVKTYTIGFEDPAFDEAPAARQVAHVLGTDHTSVYIASAEARDVIPKLPTLYDEPFADASQIPTYLVSAVARREVTVCLSGDGGDELFGGYGRYLLAHRLWSKIRWLPLRSRPAIASCIRMAVKLIDLGLVSTGDPRKASLGERGERLARLITTCDADEICALVGAFWPDPCNIVVGAGARPMPVSKNHRAPHESLFARMMLDDGKRYLPDDILAKVDRASMSMALEVRAPILDHRIVELAWRLPITMRFRDGQGKWPLRALLERHLPPALVRRPKQGFDVPIAGWLRGPLREWAEDLIGERRLVDEGFLQPGPIRAKWDEHLSGRRNWQHQLWSVLMFQTWLDLYGSATGPVLAASG